MVLLFGVVWSVTFLTCYSRLSQCANYTVLLFLLMYTVDNCIHGFTVAQLASSSYGHHHETQRLEEAQGNDCQSY